MPQLDRCLTVDISGLELLSPINIYPNPITNLFTIQSTIANGIVEIYNVLGKIIYSEKLKSDRIFLNQPAGIYLVRVSDEDKFWMEKVVIE
jgi:hypothetical protein